MKLATIFLVISGESMHDTNLYKFIVFCVLLLFFFCFVLYSKAFDKPKNQTDEISNESSEMWGIESLPKGLIFEVISIQPKSRTAAIRFYDLSQKEKEKFKGSIVKVQFKERTFHKLEVSNYFKVKGMEVVWDSYERKDDDTNPVGVTATA